MDTKFEEMPYTVADQDANVQMKSEVDDMWSNVNSANQSYRPQSVPSYYDQQQQQYASWSYSNPLGAQVPSQPLVVASSEIDYLNSGYDCSRQGVATAPTSTYEYDTPQNYDPQVCAQPSLQYSHDNVDSGIPPTEGRYVNDSYYSYPSNLVPSSAPCGTHESNYYSQVSQGTAAGSVEYRLPANTSASRSKTPSPVVPLTPNTSHIKTQLRSSFTEYEEGAGVLYDPDLLKASVTHPCSAPVSSTVPQPIPASMSRPQLMTPPVPRVTTPRRRPKDAIHPWNYKFNTIEAGTFSRINFRKPQAWKRNMNKSPPRSHRKGELYQYDESQGPFD